MDSSQAEPRAFYVPEADGFLATPLTRGPWSNELQHGGPPAALLARAVLTDHGRGDWHPVRVGVEFLRPIPIGRVVVETELLRSGRTVRAVVARLRAGGQEICREEVLLIRSRQVPLPPIPERAWAPPPPAERLPAAEFPFFLHDVGYHRAMDVRFGAGGFGRRQSSAWFRMRYPLVMGESPSPLERVLVAADSGHGITNVLDKNRFTFINPDLTVYLHRLPKGEWVGMESIMTPEPVGIGLADTLLFDASGPLGRGVQSLVIDRIMDPSA
jgi:hypothetical protein